MDLKGRNARIWYRNRQGDTASRPVKGTFIPSVIWLRTLPVWCVVGVCALLWQPPLESAPSRVELYEASVPVANQNTVQRNRALAAALEAVLIKVSGQRNVRAYPELADAIGRASGYAQQYQYRNVQAPRTVINSAGEEETVMEPELQFWVRFDPRAVDKMLKEAGLPIWGGERPMTLVWLVAEVEGERVLVGGDAGVDLQKIVIDTGEQRGIPVLFPLLDLMDQQNISVGQVWGGFMEDIRRASARYATEGILVGRAFQQSGDWWTVRWSYWDGEKENYWDQQAPELEQLLVSGVDVVANELASRYAVNAAIGGRQSLELTVRQVDNLDEYARVLSYLQSLTAVESVEPEEVRGDELNLRVQVAGGRAVLEQAIALGHILEKVDEEPARIEDLTTGATRLTYRLTP